MADLINFVSKREIDAKKEQRRKAREDILKKAKEDYEREQRKKERRKETGESSWMLPSLSKRLAEVDDNEKNTSKKKKHRKDKKQKKSKKEKKHKKSKKDTAEEQGSSESESEDEWVEKGQDPTAASTESKESSSSGQPQQRDSWMLFPPIISSPDQAMDVEDEEPEKEESQEEDSKFKALSCIDQPGQHPKELNPYWKDGGTGLPSERENAQETRQVQVSSSSSLSSDWLKKAYKRAQEQAKEEGRSFVDIVAQRYGSIGKLESMIKEAEEREAAMRGKDSNSRDRERHRHDDTRRDRDERRRRERSPDRTTRHVRESSERHGENSHRSSRDREDDKWRRRPERDDDNRGRMRNDSRTFLRPSDIDSSSSFAGKFRRPASSTSTVTSSTWDFEPKEVPRSREDRSVSRPSGGWRKKVETGTVESSSACEAESTKKEQETEDGSEESGTDSSSSSDAEEEEKKKKELVIPAKKITEADLNEIGAKIVKAEIMGNDELAVKLKAQLEEMRKTKEFQESQALESGDSGRSEEIVVLTRTDAAGNIRPLEMTTEREHRGKRKKRQKVDTHDKEGKRERYFADDDRYDLKEMVRREKMRTAEDHNAMMARLSSKASMGAGSDDFTLDDHFVSSAANKISPAQLEERERQKAIREHRILAAQLAKCRFCFENPDIAKHLIIAIGLKVYLAVPLHESMTEGHCLIIPMQHCSASTLLDEDVCSEIQIYKKGLTKMFEEMEQDVVFLETCKHLKKQHHMIIECIPMPKEIGEMSPIYFKKAIMESESEWAQNKKLIDTRKKGLRGAVPKGLPYFSVEFGLDGGFAHVIEDEELFPHYFGKEILGGMLDLEPRRWRKPRRENFEEHKKKVLQFAEWWEPFDWTKRIDRTKC